MFQQKPAIKILFAEDLPADAEMARREIIKGGIEFYYKLVDTEEEFRKELIGFEPDIVISDYSMPTFDGMKALEITRAHSFFLPFIVLTGSMNEETAVACMKAGANDYVVKEQIKRLPFAVAEAIEKSRSRVEKVKMQEQLQASLEEYRDLINGMSETVWIIHPNGKLLDVNTTAIETLGYSREELLDKGFFGVDNNLTKQEISRLAHSMATQEIQFFQTVHATKYGKNFPVEIVSRLIKYRGEKAILCVARDISDRVKIEDQLTLLSRSVEQSPVGITITNADGKIEYVNSAFTKTSGYTADEVMGKNPRILKSGNQPREFYKNLWDTIKAGKEWRGEMMNKNKSGESYWAEVSISPVLNATGEITHFIAIRENITEKKEMIDNLIEAKEKAEESDRLKSAFLANMSHEIRTPMNGIMGFAELLKEPRLTGKEQKQYIKIIQKSGRRMLNTLNDIIEISRIESGALELDLSEVNINEQIDYIHNFFKPDAMNKALTFSLHKTLPFKEANITTDPGKLNGILMNLVKNAIKYTHSGGIELGYRQKDGSLEFFVKDSGIGIEENRQHVVFDRFVQADISISKPYEGAGLGLSIAKAYVDMLGGKIWLKSEPSKGTQFFFTIPYIKKGSKISTSGSGRVLLNTDNILKNLTILVAEDDWAGRVYLSELLKGKCKKVLFAENGKEAVTMFSENPGTDLVLMDIKMPEMDGYEATAKIKEINPGAIVIAQTAYALAGDKEKALAAGCNDYLSKPFTGKSLIAMAQKYFG